LAEPAAALTLEAAACVSFLPLALTPPPPHTQVRCQAEGVNAAVIIAQLLRSGTRRTSLVQQVSLSAVEPVTPTSASALALIAPATQLLTRLLECVAVGPPML